MKNKAGFPMLALAAVLVAPMAAAQTSSASILFLRTNYRAVDSSSDTILYRVKPSGDNVVQLTPMTFHVDYRRGRWSPGGSGIVYERIPQPPGTDWQLFVVNRQGGSPLQVTTGPGKHTQASWGPYGTIAYVTDDSGDDCLGAVRADGTAQRIVFCAPHEPNHRPGYVISTPQWTPSGRGVFIEVGDYGPGLEPQWFSRIYHVNISTGAAKKLTEQVFGDPNGGGGGDQQAVAISPDGTKAVYADAGTDLVPMLLVDLATGMQTTLPAGYMPRYSRDGRKIAFVRNNRVFVMRSDGSNLREAIANPGANAHYTVGDWSSDGKHLLVNKIANDRLLQIVTLSTGAARTVTKGTADDGAWYRP
ncbi:MAG TPA: hypothetical protein VFH59_03095 [Frateuria sp.]|uniref:hypothetical protein n=1 Tax=Frateuria sp. TaxID=2211372 RepID=UPI002D7F00A6|nr:hypothetical protein [Frateuria sp.]HET6804413.1 hypothetical protein [Frateuria sp.]